MKSYRAENPSAHTDLDAKLYQAWLTGQHLIEVQW